MNFEESRRLQSAVLQSQQERGAKVAPMLPQGFTFRPEGRSGFIYYRAGDRVLEVYVEMSGVACYDMLVSPEGLDVWIFPERAPLTPDERRDVRSQLVEWLKQEKIRSDYQ